MTTGVRGPLRAQISDKTLRQDRWWLYPLLTFLVFSAFVVYATWRAFMGTDFYAAPYLSPFYAPCLTDVCAEVGADDFGTPIGSWWSLSPALVILIFPLGFRMTCYYYRKAYYRSFWLSPPACAVAEPHKAYSGERRFPLIIQNVHRYFWYVAVVFVFLLSYEAIRSFRNEDYEWGHMGLGSLILVINVVLIALYTFSCHSCRHTVGGRLRHFSKHPVRYKAWTWVSKQNARHAEYAWASLISIWVADLYIFLIANGTIDDVRFF